MSSKYRIIPLGGGGITPEGTLNIRSEGVFDVTDYASVDVDIFDDTTTKTITNNGTYNASDDNVLGYSQVTVDVPASAVDTGTKSISANGTGIDVVGYAAVDVNVPNGTETITITENGTYTPTSPNVGFSEVTVNVTGPVYEPDYLCFTAAASNSSVGMSLGEAANPNIEYSTDLINWTPWDFSVINLPNIGDKVYMRGDNPTGVSSPYDDIATFLMNGMISASGDIGTLLKYDEPVDYAFGFGSLFKNCTSLIQSPSLPAKKLSYSCYSGMFQGCTGLTTAPNLPATILAARCYYEMFKDCTSLTQVPDLPATTIVSYSCYGMFRGCTSLTQAPALPATNLSRYCYEYMFYGCSSLTQAPALPATTLEDSCYMYMFRECTSLTQAPALPATILPQSCYDGMLMGCTSLTDAPDLSNATSITGYGALSNFLRETNITAGPDLSNITSVNGNSDLSYCFYGCTKLKDVTTPNIQNLTTSILSQWLERAGTSASGTKTVRVPTGATITTGSASGIPSGWTRVDY